MGITVGFAILTLGPYLSIAGVNTYVPLPWYLLRHVPLLGAASTPSRFAAVMMLGMTALFGLALASLAERVGTRGRLLVGAVAVALLAELLPVPRTLHAADVPAVYTVIAADPRPVSVLHLPFGFRDGTKTVGYYDNARQYYQTIHGKRLIGGYLSRLTRQHVRRQRLLQDPSDAAGARRRGPVHAVASEVLRVRGAAFARRARLGYVVVDRARTSSALARLRGGVVCPRTNRRRPRLRSDIARRCRSVPRRRPVSARHPHARGVTTSITLPLR